MRKSFHYFILNRKTRHDARAREIAHEAGVYSTVASTTATSASYNINMKMYQLHGSVIRAARFAGCRAPGPGSIIVAASRRILPLRWARCERLYVILFFLVCSLACVRASSLTAACCCQFVAHRNASRAIELFACRSRRRTLGCVPVGISLSSRIQIH